MNKLQAGTYRITAVSDCDVVKIDDEYVRLADHMRIVEALAADNSELKNVAEQCVTYIRAKITNGITTHNPEYLLGALEIALEDATATNSVIADIEARARKQGAYFVANRMLAAWDAGFIDDTAKNAADIARMILTSTEFMSEAPAGDFDRSFADEILRGIAQQLRNNTEARSNGE